MDRARLIRHDFGLILRRNGGLVSDLNHGVEFIQYFFNSGERELLLLVDESIVIDVNAGTCVGH